MFNHLNAVKPLLTRETGISPENVKSHSFYCCFNSKGLRSESRRRFAVGQIEILWSIVPIVFGKFTFFWHTTSEQCRITIYKGQRLKKDSVLDMRTHFKPTETFFRTCHPALGAKKGFVKDEALKLLRTNHVFRQNI